MANYQPSEQTDQGQPVTCKISVLSEVSGTKKETLRRYSRIGLLSHRTDAASEQHLYARDDLICLERLAFMQMLGLSRAQIKERLNDRSFSLLSDLRLQMQILLEKRKRLNRLIYFMEYAEQINRDPGSEDWHYLGKIIEAIKTLRDPEQFNKYYIQGEVSKEGNTECS